MNDSPIKRVLDFVQEYTRTPAEAELVAAAQTELAELLEKAWKYDELCR
jgi:hypothetical protein